MRIKIYGVYAINGLGIYDNYSKLVTDKKYMRSEHFKVFGEREEAEDFAKSGFLQLNGTEKYLSLICNINYLSLNYFYFCKKLIQPN